jgi:hypothetical protein
MTNPQTGQHRTGYYGFSWTYLIFGWWVPLLRGELAIAALHFYSRSSRPDSGNLIVSFLYNSQYRNRKITEGFRDLQATINRFLDDHNAHSKPFEWVANPDKIIAAVRRGHQI